jgi:glycosyltransferase involved in cell wall biosynthesis
MSGTVLFIHGITEIGGAERELLTLVDALPRFGYHPVVVCPDAGPFVEELIRRGIETRRAPMPPWRKLFGYPMRATAVRRLREVIAAVRPVLLHVNDIWWLPQTLRAADGPAGLRVPIVAHVRQEIEPAKAGRYELDRADLVLPVSRQIRGSLEAGGVRSDRLRVLYSGLDLSRVPVQADGRGIRSRFGIPPDAPLLGTVANLFPRKGYEVMLRALPEILSASPDAHYLIVGSGEAAYERALRALATDLGVEGRVHFAGFQESVFPVLAAVDVYVHPAVMEGFGIAVLEAMAMGKPVVATSTGGLPEIVRDGETGLLVPPGDSEALGRAASALLRGDPSRRRALGLAGRARVESCFTVDAMMGNLVEGYAALLQHSPPPQPPAPVGAGRVGVSAGSA